MMHQTRILLADSHKRWFSSRAIDEGLIVHGRGYASIGGRLLADQDLVDAIRQLCEVSAEDPSWELLKQGIPTLDGCWALVAQWSTGRTIAAVDRSRSIPLFYSSRPNNCGVSCMPDLLRLNDDPHQIDDASAFQLFLGGYVSGKYTMYKGVYQISSGQWVEFENASRFPGIAVTTKDYFQQLPPRPSSESPERLAKTLQEILEDDFHRLTNALRHRQVVVPLSGGLDSRLIAWQLWKHGVRNVTCYTCGGQSHPDVQIAAQVAKALGFKWHFFEYSASRWANCMSDPRVTAYWDYASRGTSSPAMLEFPAMLELTKVTDPAEPPVFLPGDVGDAWASEFMLTSLDEWSPMPPSEYHSPFFPLGDSNVVSAIAYRHLNLWPIAQERWNEPPLSEVVRRIGEQVDEIGCVRDEAVWAFMVWVLKSRTSLWMVNRVRCFEFFGADFALPLASYGIIDLLRQLPREQLLYRKLYRDTLQQRVFGENGCPLKTIPVSTGVRRPKNWKDQVVGLLLALGLYRPLDRWRRRFDYRSHLAYDCWFTRGKSSSAVSIGEALESYAPICRLPAEIADVVNHFARLPSYSISSRGLLTAVTVAREYARHKLEGGEAC